jgi:hypothetical protein
MFTGKAPARARLLGIGAPHKVNLRTRVEAINHSVRLNKISVNLRTRVEALLSL